MYNDQRQTTQERSEDYPGQRSLAFCFCLLFAVFAIFCGTAAFVLDQFGAALCSAIALGAAVFFYHELR